MVTMFYLVNTMVTSVQPEISIGHMYSIKQNTNEHIVDVDVLQRWFYTVSCFGLTHICRFTQGCTKYLRVRLVSHGVYRHRVKSNKRCHDGRGKGIT